MSKENSPAIRVPTTVLCGGLANGFIALGHQVARDFDLVTTVISPSNKRPAIYHQSPLEQGRSKAFILQTYAQT